MAGAAQYGGETAGGFVYGAVSGGALEHAGGGEPGDDSFAFDVCCAEADAAGFVAGEVCLHGGDAGVAADDGFFGAAAVHEEVGGEECGECGGVVVVVGGLIPVEESGYLLGGLC